MHKKICFCLTTGVTRLALSNFFSGANAVVDLTMDPNFSGIVGFNETEVRQYFGRFIKDVAKAKGISTTEILSEMKKWNDGFQFTEKNESLHSPISVIGYLGSESKKYKAFTATVDDRKFFVEKFKQLPKQALEIFLNDGIDNPSDVSNERKITAKEIELTGKINFENPTSSVALTVLLFQNGYLRIKSFNSETDNYILEFANQKVKENYAMMLYYGCFDTLQNPTELENQLNSLLQKLDAFRWKSFILELNSLHSRIPCFLLNNAKRVPEALFQVSVYWIFPFAKYVDFGKPTMQDATNFEK